MNRITTAASHRIAAAAIRGAWATIRTGERLRGLGERMEAWSHRLAAQWRCVDDALATLTNETPSR
jgi:hypothetical protein